MSLINLILSFLFYSFFFSVSLSLSFFLSEVFNCLSHSRRRPSMPIEPEQNSFSWPFNRGNRTPLKNETISNRGGRSDTPQRP